MGFSEQGRQRLHPEEALYLLECVSGAPGGWGEGVGIKEDVGGLLGGKYTQLSIQEVCNLTART